MLERGSAAIRGTDLGTSVPPSVPCFPEDVGSWSVRWVVLHLVEQLAGHADCPTRRSTAPR